MSVKKVTAGVLLFALVLTSAFAEDEWKWETNGKSEATRGRQSRKNSDRLVFEDTDIRGRSPRIDLGGTRHDRVKTFKVTPANEDGFRVVVRPSAQLVDNPAPPVFSVVGLEEDHSSELQPHNSYTPVIIPETSHGANIPIIDETGRGGRKLVQHGGESHPRFMKKLCKMGIGFNCKKSRPVNYVNLDHLPVLPQAAYPPHPQGYHSPEPIHPPQYPIQAGGSHAYGGSNIKSSDVFHVQPVALQPVGSPIQAIPLGPSGGKVPHGPIGGGSLHGAQPYGAPQLHGGPHISSGPHLAGPHLAGSHLAGPPPLAGAPLLPGSPHLSGSPVLSGPTHLGAPHHLSNPPHLRPGYPEPHLIQDTPLEYGKSEQGALVQHIHKHTHIYRGDGPGRTDTSFEGTVSRPFIDHHPSLNSNSLYNRAGYREACECVATYKCSSFDIVDRADNIYGLLDARNNKRASVLSTEGAAEKKAEDKTSRKKREAEPRKRPRNSFLEAEERRLTVGYAPGPSGCRRGDVCCRTSARSDRGIETFKCGRSHVNGIVGRVKTPYYEDGDTDFGEYPWQAAILKRDGADLVYVCGASLINDRHLITAAHCVNKVKAYDLTVRLGEWDVQNEDEFYPNVDYEVRDLIIHPAYYAGMLHNDVAILRLSDRVDFHRYPHISPVCLPHKHSRYDGAHCQVTGWGKDAFGQVGDFQHVLKKVDVPIVRKSQCEDSLRRTRLGRSFKLHEGMSCAGGEEGKDACKGDGGGPLVCKGPEGSYELAGVVSWGIGCGERGIPGVYVDVPHYVRWIQEVVESS